MASKNSFVIVGMKKKAGLFEDDLGRGGGDEEKEGREVVGKIRRKKKEGEEERANERGREEERRRRPELLQNDEHLPRSLTSKEPNSPG